MYSRIITDPEQIPVPETERKHTDVLCTIISSIFAVVMFMIALLKFNKSTLFTIQPKPTLSTSELSAPQVQETSPAQITLDSSLPCSGPPSD